MYIHSLVLPACLCYEQLKIWLLHSVLSHMLSINTSVLLSLTHFTAGMCETVVGCFCFGTLLIM